jgi:hypothetical protein
MTETKDVAETTICGGAAPPTAREKAAREVMIPDAIPLQELAGRLSVHAGELVDALVQEGKEATSTDTLDADTAMELARKFGFAPKRGGAGAGATAAGARKPLSLQRTVESGHVRQNFSHGRSKSVVVEKRRTRKLAGPGEAEAPVEETKPEPMVAKPRPGARPGAAPARGGTPSSAAASAVS